MSDLTRRQLQLLLTGTSDQTGKGFVNEEEKRAAWFTHREALLQQCGGLRPHAYLVYELSSDEPEWIRTATELFSSGMFHQSAIQKMEQQCETMSPDQAPELYREFESVDGVLKLDPPFPVMEALVRECGHAEAWHRYRRRPELAAKYQRIGAALRTVLREKVKVVVCQEKGEHLK